MDVAESAIRLFEASNAGFGVSVDLGFLAGQAGSRPVFGVLGDTVPNKLLLHEFCGGAAGWGCEAMD